MGQKGEGRGVKWLRAHVEYSGDDCLKWPFCLLDGYGRLGHLGKVTYAHRVMCELAHGPAPSEEHLACHSCGNGGLGCVNPLHLSWKTKTENQLDRVVHGTHGGPGMRTKLTEDLAAEIRALKGKMPQREIAQRYGITRPNVSLILTGNSWGEGRVRFSRS